MLRLEAQQRFAILARNALDRNHVGFEGGEAIEQRLEQGLVGFGWKLRQVRAAEDEHLRRAAGDRCFELARIKCRSSAGERLGGGDSNERKNHDRPFAE